MNFGTRVAVVLALALTSCASATFQEKATGPGYILVSPFDEDATRRWREVVERDVADVSALFASDIPHPPVTVILDAVDVAETATLLERLDPRVDGLGGQATPDGRIRLIVAREHAGLVSTSIHAKLRHELAHVLLHRRTPNAPLWLHEGLAHEVDDTVATGRGLAFHPAPVRLALARAHAASADLTSLWTWGRSTPGGNEEESARRVLAASFVRFLVEREGDGWPDALPKFAALLPQKDPDLVAAWRTWLDATDFAALVERGATDPDPAIRSASAGALAQLAEASLSVAALRPMVGAATDAVALRVVADSACWIGASAYLVWFRAASLTDADVAALRSPDAPPAARLVGLAVAARRGEAVDPEETRALSEALPEELRRSLVVLRAFIEVGQ
jgi:hypothetical protein